MEQLCLFVLVNDLFLHAYQEIQAVAVVVYINQSSDIKSWSFALRKQRSHLNYL